MKSRFILCAAVMAGFAVAAGPAQAAPLIGYVNLQKAILSVDDGQDAKDKLERTLKQKQKELTSKKDGLEALTKKLSAGQLTSAEREQLNKKRMELQEAFMKEQGELQRLERETLGKIMKKMRKVIDGIGRKGGYTMILEVNENRLLFAQDHLDLTNEVIRKYNSKYAKKGK